MEHSRAVTENVVKNLITNFKCEGDYQQMISSIHPIISNAMFHRENELLEEERFKSLITLSRVLDDTNINKAISSLKYQLDIKKK